MIRGTWGSCAMPTIVQRCDTISFLRAHVRGRHFTAVPVYGWMLVSFLFAACRTNATVLDTREQAGAPMVLGVAPMGASSTGEKRDARQK